MAQGAWRRARGPAAFGPPLGQGYGVALIGGVNLPTARGLNPNSRNQNPLPGRRRPLRVKALKRTHKGPQGPLPGAKRGFQPRDHGPGARPGEVGIGPEGETPEATGALGGRQPGVWS